MIERWNLLNLRAIKHYFYVKDSLEASPTQCRVMVLALSTCSLLAGSLPRLATPLSNWTLTHYITWLLSCYSYNLIGKN